MQSRGAKPAPFNKSGNGNDEERAGTPRHRILVALNIESKPGNTALGHRACPIQSGGRVRGPKRRLPRVRPRALRKPKLPAGMNSRRSAAVVVQF
jgi:hypothetical protein